MGGIYIRKLATVILHGDHEFFLLPILHYNEYANKIIILTVYNSSPVKIKLLEIKYKCTMYELNVLFYKNKLTSLFTSVLVDKL